MIGAIESNADSVILLAKILVGVFVVAMIFGAMSRNR